MGITAARQGLCSPACRRMADVLCRAVLCYVAMQHGRIVVHRADNSAYCREHSQTHYYVTAARLMACLICDEAWHALIEPLADQAPTGESILIPEVMVVPKLGYSVLMTERSSSHSPSLSILGTLMWPRVGTRGEKPPEAMDWHSV